MLLYLTLQELSCLDRSGNTVDWFLEVKGNNGLNAYYLDANAKTKFVAAGLVTDTTNPVWRTSKQIYDNQNLSSAMFNDELPNGSTSSSLAHQKGFLAFDEVTNTGFYMLHTTPGWPPMQNDTFTYENTVYAQDFFCVNIDKTNLDIVGQNLYVTRPQIYYNSFTTAFLSGVPNLQKALNKQYNSSAAAVSAVLRSRKGVTFEFFYKNKQAAIDIFADLIAPHYKQSMYVETWLRDTSATAYCGTYSVEMIGYVNFVGQQWKETQDHCKWGVGTAGLFACFNDNNFQASQANRGGGAICMKDSVVAEALIGTIVSMSDKVVCSTASTFEDEFDPEIVE